MALILNIETATTNCSVSLSNDGTILALKEENNLGYSHAEKLHLFIDEVFRFANVELKNIDAIAVSKGPGSYTGLRIGVSTAKGLCYALDKPLIAINTLEILAFQVGQIDGKFIVPMLDARRMEVYSAVYNSDYNCVEETEAKIIDVLSYADMLNQGKTYFIGSGVSKTKALIYHPNAVYIEEKLPSAKEMGPLATLKYQQNLIEDVAYFEPYYLKDFVALKKKH